MPINYGNLIYWEKHYKETPGERFDWLTSYTAIKPLINHVVGKESRVLYAGCGSSTLCQEMHDDGYGELTSIDFSKEVIQQMIKRNNEPTNKGKTRPSLKFRVMDATKMAGLEDSTFDVVMDKCLLDAVLCGEDSTRKALKMLREVGRVLRAGGIYLMFSYAAPKHRIFYLRNRLVRMEVRCFKLQHMDAWLRGQSPKELEKSTTSNLKAVKSVEKVDHYCYLCTKAEGEAVISKPIKEKSGRNSKKPEPERVEEQQEQEQHSLERENEDEVGQDEDQDGEKLDNKLDQEQSPVAKEPSVDYLDPNEQPASEQGGTD